MPLLATVSSSIHPSIYFFSFLPLELKIFIKSKEKLESEGGEREFTMEIKNNVFSRLLFFIFSLLEQKAGIRNSQHNSSLNGWIEWQEMSRSSSTKCLFGDIIHQCELFSIFIISKLSQTAQGDRNRSTSSQISHGRKFLPPTNDKFFLFLVHGIWKNEEQKQKERKMKENFHHHNVAQFVVAVSWAELNWGYFAIQDTHNNNFECVI